MPGDSLAVYTAAGAALGAAPVAGVASIDRPELASLTQRLASLPRLDLSPDATDTAYFNVSVKVRRNPALRPCEAAQARHAKHNYWQHEGTDIPYLALVRMLSGTHLRMLSLTHLTPASCHDLARSPTKYWLCRPCELRPARTPRMVCASVRPHERSCMSLSSPARAPGCCTCRLCSAQAFPAAWTESLDADCIAADLSRVRSGGDSPHWHCVHSPVSV
jgi:hypothetical protein